MEEILEKMGISENTIKQIEDVSPNVKNLDKVDILEKIKILSDINCDNIEIRNIISSNPYYLERISTDINKLIEKLQKLGFDNLDILFDSNPYILNLDDFEVENYIKEKESEGKNIEDILDDMSSNPLIFNDI